MTIVQKGVELAAKRMPKVIGPKAHAVIDYAVAVTFFTAGALFWRRNKRAAISSFVCGAAATMNSALTDYPGGMWKVMNFHTHGKIDAGLAGITASMPSMMGFSDEKEGRFFELAAIAETGATAMTDFDAMDRTDYYRYHKAA